jgi:hypothetical protein
MVSVLKGVGYAISTLSVILLGIVSWKNASEQPLLFTCLLLGMASSMVGMLLRWISHRMEQKEKAAEEALAPSRKPVRRAYLALDPVNGD